MHQISCKMDLLPAKEFFSDGYYDIFVSFSGQVLQNLNEADFVALGHIMVKYFKFDVTDRDFWNSYVRQAESTLLAHGSNSHGQEKLIQSIKESLATVQSEKAAQLGQKVGVLQ